MLVAALDLWKDCKLQCVSSHDEGWSRKLFACWSVYPHQDSMNGTAIQWGCCCCCCAFCAFLTQYLYSMVLVKLSGVTRVAVVVWPFERVFHFNLPNTRKQHRWCTRILQDDQWSYCFFWINPSKGWLEIHHLKAGRFCSQTVWKLYENCHILDILLGKFLSSKSSSNRWNQVFAFCGLVEMLTTFVSGPNFWRWRGGW